MALVLTRTVVIAAISLTCIDAESRVGFLTDQAGDGKGNMVSKEDLERSLQASLDAVLSGGGGVAGKRLLAIEASTWRTFQSLPKNSLGRLDPRGVRHIIHSYFAKEHGWLINGLEPHGMTTNVTEVHDVSILKEKAPALVETLLETRQHGHGLALNDVVAMIGALEQLIFDESVELLQIAYNLNGHSLGDKLQEAALHEVLRSYLLVFGQGHQADVSNVSKHQEMKAALSWPELDDFQHDIVMNIAYANRHQANPFRPRTYTFADVASIVTEMAQNYGKWQNAECSAMKENLMELDTDGSGRVPLKAFHTQPDGSVYQFTESRDYLRQIGALDETLKGVPRVLIANYVAGPSNCIASSSYYSVCCLNECELLLNELEGVVQAPSASPEDLLSLVSKLSSATVSAPRQLPRTLADKLHSIADLHGGMVPLQGRLFAQWLHYAFPNECQYPSIVESSTILTPNQWLGGKSAASSHERQSASAAMLQPTQVAPDSALAQWSDHEVLPLHEPSVSILSMFHASGGLRSLLRIAAMLAGLYIIVQAVQAAFGNVEMALLRQSNAKDVETPYHHRIQSDNALSMHV